jgi:hypothetical protein
MKWLRNFTFLFIALNAMMEIIFPTHKYSGLVRDWLNIYQKIQLGLTLCLFAFVVYVKIKGIKNLDRYRIYFYLILLLWLAGYFYILQV